MRRHLNHPAHRARRPRPSLLSGVETLRRLEGTLPHLPPPGLGTATTPPTAPRPRKAVPVPGFRGRLPPSQAVGQEGDPVTPENPPTSVYGAS
ncbi:hypothetical protein D6C92_06619 [Aureobasidium pullulans]|nr:hypothetical protein D6C92_06619 [Aureobasidium pullulans]